MTLFLFLVWLQMSAQPRSAWQNCITVNNMPCARAADETDDRARSGCDADNSCAGGNGETDGKPPITGTNNPPKGQLTKPEALELVDVPAVQVEEDTSDTWWSVPSTGDADVQVKGIQRRWTCADKSRVLLTSEDGKKHCVKF